MSTAWGVVDARVAAGQKGRWRAQLHDSALPAFNQLRIMRRQSGTGEEALVFTSALYVAAYLPTATNMRPLWTPHSNAGGNLSAAENQHLFYLWLYYSDMDEQDLATAIAENNFEVMSVLFGAGRSLGAFGHDASPLTAADKQAAVTDYAEFVRGFDRAQAQPQQLSYLLTPTETPEFPRLDKWYVRGAGVNCGAFTVYPLTFRTQTEEERK